MEFDAYCRDGNVYRIYNLYFDDENNSVINASLARPKFKEKLRLRSYEPPENDGDTVYLELKRKINGIVTKRRAPMTYREALRFVKSGEAPRAESYVRERMYRELGYFIGRKNLSPKVAISYERIALFSKTDPALRITFDQNILTQRTDADLYHSGGEQLLRPDERLMEVKFLHAPPKKLTDELTELKIFMQSFSKYGNEYSRLRGREFLHLDDREEIERKLKND